jgi:hypothetical protein
MVKEKKSKIKVLANSDCVITTKQNGLKLSYNFKVGQEYDVESNHLNILLETGKVTEVKAK